MTAQVQPSRLRSRSAVIVVVLLAIPIIANALALFGVVDADSQLLFSGIQKTIVPGILNGLPYIDPSGGTTYEPEAREALRQWFSGQVPWWNHFEGLGFPLAGGIVPGVFSPYLPILALPNGVILQQLVGQILCGLFTYKALRLIGCSPFAACIGAALFELNGTFAWLGSVWAMPIVALPLWICGIELIRRGGRRDAWFGFACTALATYVAVVSSFIETGFIEGLFVIAWFASRLPGVGVRGAVRLAALSGAGGFVGSLLASPQIVAFAEVLKFGISTHHAGTIGFNSITTDGVPQFFLPYVWGPIFKFRTVAIDSVWGNVGGYAGVATLVVASAAFGARRLRPLVVMLVAWIVLTVGAEFGSPFLVQVINIIPGVKYTAQYRYAPPTWEFALAVLCGLLITQWQADDRFFLRAPHRIALAALGVVLAGFTYQHAATLGDLLVQRHYTWWLSLSLAVGIFAVVAAIVCMKRPGARSQGFLGAVLVGEALLYYITPTLYYPRGGSIDNGYVRAFHDGSGYERLYSINALQPDSGTFYQIPQINYSDVVIPSNYVDFLAQLDPYNGNPVLFLPYRLVATPGIPTLADILEWHRRRYESVAVKYVDATPDQILPSFAPAIQPPQRAYTLGNARLSGDFGGLLHGDSVTTLRFSVLGTGMPDGVVTARLCSGGTCVSGDAMLDGRSKQDQQVILKFRRSLPVANGHVSFTIAQREFHRPAQLPLYSRGSDDEFVSGKLGMFPNIWLRTQLIPFSVPTGASANTTVELGNGPVIATMPAPEVDGSIVSVAVLEASHSGKIRLRLCSKQCVTGESTLRAGPDGYVEIPLAYPVSIDTEALKAEFSAGGRQGAESLSIFSEAPGFPQQLIVKRQPMPGLAPKVRFAIATSLPIEAYHGPTTSLFRLPSPQAYFAADNCRLEPTSRDVLETHCRENSTLIRRELYYPGWTATVNGADAAIKSYDTLLEEVKVPKGESTVRFHYEPRHARPALITSAIAFAFIVACFVFGLRSPHRPQDAIAS